MILFLNYLPALLIVAFIFFVVKFPKYLVKALVALVLSLGVLMAVTPSYTPKNSIQRTTLPAVKSSDAVIVDRLSKPDTLEERDARLEEKIDWKRQIEDTKRSEQTESEDE